METWKNILAAKKMVYLAAGGNPVGRDEGRGVHLWAILVILSLAMYLTSGLPNPKGEMGKETDPQETQQEPTWGQNGELRVHFDCSKMQRGENCKHNNRGLQINKKKEKTIYHNPMAMSRKRRELSNLSIIPICRNCNKTVWVGGKRESTFVAYLRVNKLCYDKNKLDMCTLNGKTYWIGQNEKLQTASLNSGPIILDLLSKNDERVCLKLDKIFCFSKDEEGMDPENKIQKVAQELKRQELETKRNKMEQERMRSLSEQYEQLEKQSSDWSLPASSKNLFVDLVQEIATELGLSNCWICGGLKSAERWPWKGEILAPEQLLKWDSKILKTMSQPEGWTLDERIIGTTCISREGNTYTELVGYTPCLSTLTVNSNNKTKVWQPEPPNGYWSKEKEKGCNWVSEIEFYWHELTGVNPYHSLTDLKEFWERPENADIKWRAPSRIYWICGKKAYSELPRK
ncbi:hypothetical protein DUI87_03323 [Hirundo rustica rustica]|uniref:Uncharacterized protein n=1 Tax=Hirundo rustica rustica TaxID=333673 RepID=A0A3M0L2K0_HIRRU|nr:hypothetical protein DUI87_03323 [Hirundo rustica rustica]